MQCHSQAAKEAQYVDIVINDKPSHTIVDTGVEANIMTKSMAAKLRLSYSLSDTCLKTISALPTLMCRVA